MRLFRLIVVAAVFGVFLAVPSFAAAADPYNAYIACGYRTDKPAATECPKDGRIGAFFTSNDAAVMFKTCVRFPNGQQQCTKKQSAAQGQTYVNRIKAGTKGKLVVRWKVDGVVVAKYSIQVV